jgi:hypothetical protein
METSTERSRVRAERLRRLADDHGLSPNARTTAGEDLGKALARPELLRPWCAVTYSPADETVYLYLHHDTVAAAREFAEALFADPGFAELPLEVVDLDGGARLVARLGALGWNSPRDRDPRPARRLLDKRPVRFGYPRFSCRRAWGRS